KTHLHPAKFGFGSLSRMSSVTPLTLLILVAWVQPVWGQRVRQNQKDIGVAGRQLFVDAMKAMKAAPKKGNTAGVDNRYDEFVRFHADSTVPNSPGSAHSTGVPSPAFLPWHRQLLLDFENEVRSLRPTGDPDKFKNFTIPYWDWTVDDFPHHLDIAAADNLFMGSNGDAADGKLVKQGPFRANAPVSDRWITLEGGIGNTVRLLQRDFDDIGQLKIDGPKGLQAVLKLTDYNMFNTDVEHMRAGLHADAHVRVGGQLFRV